MNRGELKARFAGCGGFLGCFTLLMRVSRAHAVLISNTINPLQQQDASWSSACFIQRPFFAWRMESSSVAVVSAVLGDFFEKHPPDLLLPTAKILATLLKNASCKNDEKYRSIRLSNPKIQQKIVQVSDALDILALAGFSVLNEKDTDCLVYTPPNDSLEIAKAICHQLETKIQELEKCSQEKKAPVSQPDSSSPFLSAEERKKRVEQAKTLMGRRQAGTTRSCQTQGAGFGVCQYCGHACGRDPATIRCWSPQRPTCCCRHGARDQGLACRHDQHQHGGRAQ